MRAWARDSRRVALFATTFLLVPPAARGLVLLDWNVGGNNAADWSTNAAQVQAIGRVVAYLRPDVITFQEIPLEHAGQMTSFVDRFLPGYVLASSPGTDGYLQSVIISRHPIRRAASWLDNAPLDAFGSDQSFTRDLFEAEIAAPEFVEPLHVFTAHLKSGTTANADFARRAAEAGAISNFLVTMFLPQYGARPYVLTGDLNEDIGRPKAQSRLPVQRLANDATGLHLTTPVNPTGGDERTWSTRLPALSVRYDYVLPSGFLATNLVRSQVFRTSTLSPLPLELRRDDDRTASDHLPILMVWRSPGAGPVAMAWTRAADGRLRLAWPAVPEYAYWVETTNDLNEWRRLAGPLQTRDQAIAFESPTDFGHALFRIRRVP